MPLLFAVTLFVSASLLFMVQPMVGKMILPLLGGSPAVWNACMVFFQAMLLNGYLYSHFLSTRLGPKKQWMMHGVVLLAPVAVMLLSVAFSARHTPIAVVESLAPSGDSSPFLAAMAILMVAIGVQFFFVSTSAPLLQKWFSYTGHPSSRDPYFLYAASNAGSLISLLGYPLFIDPFLTISQQAWLFGIIFAIMIALIALCGSAAANPIGVPPPSKNQPRAKVEAPAVYEPPPSIRRIAKWILLAFVPSSWMLSVTFFMTTDIASVPLLWVVPLALYLVTFIIAFSRVPPWFRLVIGNLAPVMILLLIFVILARDFMNSLSTGLELTLHIATFFIVALMCHYELALDRPKDVAHLTKYFLMMSVGGVLGGLFNALIAPIVFTWAPKAYEYYVTMMVACLMVPNLSVAAPSPAGVPMESASRYQRNKQLIGRILDVILPVLVGVAYWYLVADIHYREFYAEWVNWMVSFSFLKNSEGTIVAISLVAVPVMSCFFFVDRAFRFALAVAILLVINLYRDEDPRIVYNERTFFGILKVEQRGIFTRLVHGTTLHGTQINDKFQLHVADITQAFGVSNTWEALAIEGTLATWDPRQEPLTYYHRTGPVGAMFHELRTRKNGVDAKADIAMVGLGSGSVSCYALPGQRLTFYEIDSAVRRLVAEKADYFTYVRDAKRRGATLDFRMGDARLKLKEDEDRKFALLLVDAFSSDAIPVHLLTEQAVELYMNRITEDGLLALHISNKYVELEPVVARIAEKLGLAARSWSDNWAPVDRSERPEDHYYHPPPLGKTASSWVILARSESILGSMAGTPAAQALAFGVKNEPLHALLHEFGTEKNANEALIDRYGDDYSSIRSGDDKEKKEKGLDIADFQEKYGRQAAAVALYGRRGYEQKKTLGDLNLYIYGKFFHPLEVNPDVPLWTDDYSDVLRVMRLKEVQWIRKKLGLPTPIAGDE